MNIKTLFPIFLFTILLLTNCKKIATPEPSVKAVFGKWRYVFSSGGIFGGGPLWPTDKSIFIEFKENGHYKYHEKQKPVKRETYKFTVDENNPDRYIIDFEKNGTPDKGFYFTHDTLVLFDRYVADGGVYTFVKK